MDKSSIVRKGSRTAKTNLVKAITAGLKVTTPREPRKRLFCGDASYCPRKAVLMATTTGTNTVDAAGRLYMDTGTAAHRIIQEGLQKVGVLVEAERRLFIKYKSGITLSGFIDAVINLNGFNEILEIKTCGALPARPKKEHLHQALTYSLTTGIPSVTIFYLSRKVASWDGKLECVEFRIEPTVEQLTEVARLLATSLVGTAKNKMPQIPMHISSESHCGFCPFKSTCWGDEAKHFPPMPRTMIAEIGKLTEDLMQEYYKLRASHG